MMKYILFYVFVLNLYFLSLNAQVTKADYYNIIDNKVFTFSKQKSDAPFDTITAFVNTNFKTQEDRARAYYTWIALNISYDVEHLNELNLMQIFSVNRMTSTGQKSLDVLKSKKAVCEGYSNLMVDFCKASSIPCFLVCGYVKTPEGNIPEILHAWNVLRVDSAWVMLDITWSSGYLNQENKYVKRFSNMYFIPKPKVFIKDHFPLDPLWQLLKYPFTKKDFENDSLTISHSPVFNYPDSLRLYLSKTEKERKYIDLLHYYSADPANTVNARNLDVWHNNLIANELNTAAAYHSDFLQIVNTRLSKKPTLPDCKKARMALDSIQSYNNRAQLILESNKAHTIEYEEVFKKMNAAIAENKKGIKINYEYLNKTQAYIKKKK